MEENLKTDAEKDREEERAEGGLEAMRAKALESLKGYPGEGNEKFSEAMRQVKAHSTYHVFHQSTVVAICFAFFLIIIASSLDLYGSIAYGLAGYYAQRPLHVIINQGKKLSRVYQIIAWVFITLGAYTVINR